ncbi:Protein of unknown function [Gryllus bimaculatus]|nr:Protein of unknown function [Gryllus bimaculatus]
MAIPANASSTACCISFTSFFGFEFTTLITGSTAIPTMIMKTVGNMKAKIDNVQGWDLEDGKYCNWETELEVFLRDYIQNQKINYESNVKFGDISEAIKP